MNIGGLGARAALRQKPTRKCERCGLRYPKDLADCPHCHTIRTQADLEAFKAEKAAERAAGVRLGRLFIIVALILLALLLLSG